MRAVSTIKSAFLQVFRPNLIRAGYYDANNFGDQLTIPILQHLGARAVRSPSYRFADLSGVGSILHMFPEEFDGWILGSGSIKPDSRRLSKAVPRLLRGPLSAAVVGAPADTDYADPGIVADTVFPTGDVKKTDVVGVVPHYSDYDRVNELIGGRPGFRIIDVRRPPEDVVRDIFSSAAVLSSSLHGLVVADSLGIPSAWFLSGNVIGGEFKFRDYFMGVGYDRSPFNLNTSDELDLAASSAFCPGAELLDAAKRRVLGAYRDYLEIRNIVTVNECRDEVAT